eukprot:398071_1
MIGLFLNWKYTTIASCFVKYFKESVSFNAKKQIIVQTLKMDGALWPTDQCWKAIVEQIIVDRHEIEWCDILNCMDDGALNKLYDAHKNTISNVSNMKFQNKVNEGSSAMKDNSKWLQSEINELKRMHQLDKD